MRRGPSVRKCTNRAEAVVEIRNKGIAMLESVIAGDVVAEHAVGRRDMAAPDARPSGADRLAVRKLEVEATRVAAALADIRRVALTRADLSSRRDRQFPAS